MQMAIDVAGFTPAEADQLRQAMGSKRSRAADGAAAPAAVRRDGRAGDHRRGRRRALRQDGRVRQLRLPRVAHRVVRLPRVLVVVAQVLRAGGVLRGAAQRPADGLLEPAHADAGRPPPRRGRAHTGPQRLAGAGHAASRAPSSTGGVAVRLGDRFGARHRLGSGRGDRGRPAVLVDRGVGARRAGAVSWPSWRRWPRPGCSASASAWSGARRCGRWARRCSPGRGACRASSSAPRRRRCRAWTPVEEAVADLWATGVSPDGHPTRFLRTSPRTNWASSRRRACGTCEPTVAGARRRRRHPPPAADDRPGRDVPQPGGRDRADQRRRLQGLLGQRYRKVARGAPAMLIRGRLERSEGVINVVADELMALPVPASQRQPRLQVRPAPVIPLFRTSRTAGGRRRAGSRQPRHPKGAAIVATPAPGHPTCRTRRSARSRASAARRCAEITRQPRRTRVKNSASESPSLAIACDTDGSTIVRVAAVSSSATTTCGSASRSIVCNVPDQASPTIANASMAEHTSSLAEQTSCVGSRRQALEPHQRQSRLCSTRRARPAHRRADDALDRDASSTRSSRWWRSRRPPWRGRAAGSIEEFAPVIERLRDGATIGT